jgi:hypothetical protein
MKYGHQFIIFMKSPTDLVPEENAEALVARAALENALDETTVVPFNEPVSSANYDMKEYEARMTGNDRVYVVGHGNSGSQTVGKCKAEDWAKTFDTMTNRYKIRRVSFVACHSGGDGKIAPHRFVEEFFGYAKGFVTEVTGYTGTVQLNITTHSGNPEAVRYRTWGGKELWLVKGTGRKVVSHDHDEGDNTRKVYITSDEEGRASIKARGWTNKL